MGQIVYKIVSLDAWQSALGEGAYEGSDVDMSDGFIHFSAADQVKETARKHFAGQDGLLLVAISASQLGKNLKWESSRGGALFPHLYGKLPMPAVLWSYPLKLEGKTHRFPDALPDEV